MTIETTQPVHESVISQELFQYNEVKNKVTDLLAKVEDYFNSKDVSFLEGGEGFLPTPLKIKTLDLRDYSDLRNAKITVPPGLKVDFKTYAQILLDGAHMVANVKDNVLSPYARWLSTNINDPKNLISGRGGDIRRFKPNDIDIVYEEMSKAFKKGNTTNVGKFGEYFSRNKEVGEVVSLEKEISDILISVDRKEILNKVNELTYYLELLHTTVKEMDDVDISSKTGTVLSKLTYTVAREIEFMGVIFYNYRSFHQALNSTISNI